MEKLGNCKICGDHGLKVEAVGIYEVPLPESEGTGSDDVPLCRHHAVDYVDEGKISLAIKGMGLLQIRLSPRYVETAN
jgi:hypothetical protein